MFLDTCEWSNPGADRFFGDQIEAVQRYELPAPVKAELVAKINRRNYDDLVTIQKYSILGVTGRLYDSGIQNMYFGSNKVCGTITRESWKFSHQEFAMVYCSNNGDTCVMIPAVCGNVSLIQRKPLATAAPKLELGPQTLPDSYGDLPAWDFKIEPWSDSAPEYHPPTRPPRPAPPRPMPEPSSIYNVLLGIVLLVLVSITRRKLV